MSSPVVEDVSVVVPTLGRPMVEGCLDAIAVGTRWPAELIVVDQGSSPTVSEKLADLRGAGLRAVHLPSSETGISAATNRGLERVRTTFVAVTHDDCRPAASWLEMLIARLEDTGDAVVTGRVDPCGDGEVLTIKTSAVAAVYTRPLIDGDVLFPPNMAFPIGLVDRIGWFDEHPSLRVAGEDNDWAYRALRAGVAIVYEPTAVVGHLARFSAEDLPALHRRYARGQGSFYGKWLRRGDAFIARRALRDLARAPWLLARGVVTRNPRLVAMGRGELLGLAPGIVAGLRNR